MTQLEAAPTAIPADIESTLEQFRSELTGYCYRMLGSTFEAEDAGPMSTGRSRRLRPLSASRHTFVAIR